jgi:hypothetical protein
VITEIEDITIKTSASNDVVVEKNSYKVFIGFKKPGGGISIFSACGVYTYLGSIFHRHPEEIYKSISDLAFGDGDGFMQEYLLLDEATKAVTQASLFANIMQCVCFRKKESYFYIK